MTDPNEQRDDYVVYNLIIDKKVDNRQKLNCLNRCLTSNIISSHLRGNYNIHSIGLDVQDSISIRMLPFFNN